MTHGLRFPSDRIRALACSLVGGLVLSAVPVCAQESSLPSDADARIEFYKARLRGPGSYPAYARLGLAYSQKARETGQLHYYDQAERNLLTSLRHQRNFEALRGLAAVYLARHQFQESLRYAQEAAETLPEDPEAQGALFDAYLALGQWEQASAVLEAMLEVQPGFAAHSREAGLQRYRGDVASAYDAMQQACADAEAQSFPAETRAWCQVQLGALSLDDCEPEKAEAPLKRALEIFPDYPSALEHLAELRAAQGRIDEALQLQQQVLQKSGDSHLRTTLADFYEAAGKQEYAKQERERALEEMRKSAASGVRVYWRPLALLLLAEPATAAEGSRWAERDWDNRHDAYAAATLAWAYYQNQRDDEARRLIEDALRPGRKDASTFFHAALIYSRLGQAADAQAYVEQTLRCPWQLPPADRRQAEKLRSDLTRVPER